MTSQRSASTQGRRSLSVVVPCYNEEDVLLTTHQRLTSVLGGIDVDTTELLYVDDGSTDGTFDTLRRLHEEDPRVRVVSLSRNFGHQIAVTAGLAHSSGEGVVIIDADLQDPPEVIPQMVNRWRSGVDVVFGQRAARTGESAFKRLTAAAFYRLLNRLADVPIPIDTGDFRLMDRRVVEAVLSMPEQDRFLRGMVAWAGFRQEALLFSREPRAAGTTKYPLARMMRFAGDAVISFSMAPLRITTWIGFAASGLALLGIVYAMAMRLLTDIWVPGWTALMIAVLFLGGVQLISLGMLGEYLGRVYGETKRRPLYLVREQLGIHPQAARAGFSHRDEEQC